MTQLGESTNSTTLNQISLHASDAVAVGGLAVEQVQASDAVEGEAVE